MQAILLSSEEVANRAKELYDNGIREQVETEENIGKMVIIDIETGEYAIDETGRESANYLRNKNRFARLFGIRIGYTGFTEFLSLPLAAVTLLNFPFVYDMYATLADNSIVLLPVHQATIIWNGEEREVNILATGKRPLLGTALLDGHELCIQFTESGLVTIEDL